MSADFAGQLLDWYARHARRLPWRSASRKAARAPDPYHIWVSEIMLQQTRVATVIPYYRRWLRRFPSLRALAAARQQEVLQLWEGLGYYSRARNLHHAAQLVVQEHAGRLPRTIAGLRRLPGIGPYTAAAIASIAFGVDAAVLDGNVRRVLARAFDLDDDVKSPAGENKLAALAQSLLPPGRAGDYNQALMDLGASVCTPRAPACDACPLHDPCLARQRGTQLQRPVRRARPSLPERYAAAVVLRRPPDRGTGGRVLLVQRPADELLGGLWAFPSLTLDADALPTPAQLRRALAQRWGLRAEIGRPRQTILHAFTHFRLTLRVFDAAWLAGPGAAPAPWKWVRLSDLAAYPMGRPDRLIAQRLQSE